MNKNILSNYLFKSASFSFVVLGTLISISPNELLWLQWGEDYALFTMLLFFSLGFLAFLFDYKQYMVMFLAGCASIGLHLNNGVEFSSIAKNTNKANQLSLGLFHLPENEEDIDSALVTIVDRAADFLLIQDLPNSVYPQVKEYLSCCGYEGHWCPMDGITNQGMGMFSKHSFAWVQENAAPVANVLHSEVHATLETQRLYLAQCSRTGFRPGLFWIDHRLGEPGAQLRQLS